MSVIDFSAAPDRPESQMPPGEDRLRASPTFALAFTLDGRPYVAKEVEPYTQYWLSEPERVLLGLFSGRRGETVGVALQAYLRLADRPVSSSKVARLRRLIEDMRATGVLVSARDDTSRYDAGMAEDYLKHRPFPPEIAELIVREGPVTPESRVLDLAGGPGSLALALAATSRRVSLMDLSRGFVTAAAREAERRRLALTALHESCNRLATHDQSYDVVTISQALHWLDDVLVCRGLGHVLRQGGSFFVMLSAMRLAEDHPLAFLLGDNSILGPKAPVPFEQEALALMRRLTLLFEALRPPELPPGHAIAPAGLRLFRQTRPFGLGYARAFMSPRHIEMTGLEPTDFWSDVDLRCVMATPRQRLGIQDWAVLQFRRGPAGWETPQVGRLPVTEIGWTGPDDD